MLIKSFTVHQGISGKKVEIPSGTNTQPISNRSNLGHQEQPHLSFNHRIVKYRVSGSQNLSPTKSPIHIGNYQQKKSPVPFGISKTKSQSILATTESPHCWKLHKLKSNQHWYLESLTFEKGRSIKKQPKTLLHYHMHYI